jgi:hypothetical protein
MCEECEEFPVQYVAYFNKPGGKLWRPAQKVAPRSWAIDIVPSEPAAIPAREFICVGVSAASAPAAPPSIAETAPVDHRTATADASPSRIV